jgi:hypothetical protein
MRHCSSRLEFVHEPAPLSAMSDAQASPPKWLEYIYRTAHPALRWLLTKLAEWIGENLQELGFPDKADQRAEPGTGWTQAELNYILDAHVLNCALLHLDVWNGSLSCSGVLCVLDVIPSICQRSLSIPSTQRLELSLIL